MIIKYGIDKIVKEAALVVEGRAWGGVFLPRVVAFPFPNETPTGRGPTNREGLVEVEGEEVEEERIVKEMEAFFE